MPLPPVLTSSISWKRSCLWIIVSLLLAAIPALADDPPVRGPFKQDRPINDAILSRIAAMKPNEAVLLGQAGVVGEFNDIALRYELDKRGPRGRDFSIKMVWAEDRQRVLFCGANHNVPHRLNDVWEFDLAAFSWIMLYAPDNPRDYTGLGKDPSDVGFQEGVFVTKREGPGIIGHTWWGITYDPREQELYFLNTWVTDQKKAAELIGGDPNSLYTGPPLWSFSPSSREWTMHRTEKPYPRAIFGGFLEYVPELKGSIWHANNWQMHGSWLYQPKANTWKELKPNDEKSAEFEEHAPQPEQVGYYDPQRQMLIMHRHKTTSHYNVQTNQWKKVIDAPKDSEEIPFGHDAYSPMYHDPISGHGLLVEFKTNQMWAYDPDKISWRKLQPTGDPMPEGNKRLAYVDPTRNVFVIINGTDTWAYRYTATSKAE